MQMKRPTVETVMTSDVVTVSPDDSFKDVITALADHEISGAPVVDEGGRLIGVVTEADLLRKAAAGQGGPGRRQRLERQRSEATTAGEAMSSPAVTTTADTAVAEAARSMCRHGFKRLPVVDPDGRPVGIVSRADLLSVFLRADAEIHDEVIHEIVIQSLWLDPAEVEVDVRDGVVTLRGRVPVASLVPIAERLTASVDGVVRVINRLDYDEDDSARPHRGRAGRRH
ncbi:CBS domain-containing protein [Actinomadura nitritigenes]|uniref:CBS domain-containing protein n=2 Tax=Actinomadura nitritigenes TaxID=134602 RepID=A0ABS3R6N5_9ACTN|nr:CBS domain-containing protein [Actinomadura nitritigenes]